MFTRLTFFSALIVCVLAGPALGQTVVRFDTNVGNIDLVLNPQDRFELRGHEENMLAYIESGRYDGVILNRADRTSAENPLLDNVLQFGGLTSDSQTVPATTAGFDPVETFDPVIVDSDGDGNVDFNRDDLTNTRGTVSLALAAGNVNSGTASFFVNVRDNPFDVDGQGFVPFAEVVDMSTVDLIMRLDQANLGGTTFSNIPLIDSTDNLMVFVERAYVLMEDAGMGMAMAATAPGGDGGSGGGGVAAISAVPEPSSLLLLLAGLALCTRRRGSRN